MMYEWLITCEFRKGPAPGPYSIHVPFVPFVGLVLTGDGAPELVVREVTYNLTAAAFEVTARALGTLASVDALLSAQAEREWDPEDTPGTTRLVRRPGPTDEDIPF